MKQQAEFETFSNSLFCKVNLKPDELEAVRFIASGIRTAGFEAKIVGGAVRDLLCAKIPDDVDMVTTATPDELAGIFPEIKLTGQSFGVSRLRVNRTEIEIASARRERNYMDGRHPESICCTRSLQEDSLRRDFTINAMMLDPETGEILDFHGGIRDLKRGIIRTVGDPVQRFQEDYLRMLRAVRFAARSSFTIEPATFDAMKKLSHLAANLAGERIREELTRILTGRFPDRALRLLSQSGLLASVLPEIDRLRGVTQPEEFHPEGDVFEHTLLMLRHMAYPDPLLAWSVLLHDVGKAVTRSVDKNDRIRFFGHEDEGEKIARSILERLHFSRAETETVAHAVRNHMRMASVCRMKKAKLRRLMGDPDFAIELELHRLDCIACHQFMENFVFLLDQLCAEPVLQLPEPWVKGRDLVNAGFSPSPHFKKVLDDTFEQQLSDVFAGPEEALEFAKITLSRLQSNMT